MGGILRTGVLLGLLLTVSFGAMEVADTNEEASESSLRFILSGEEKDSENLPTGVSSELLVKTLISLVLVLALGLAVAYAAKHLLPRLGMHAGKEIRVLETTGLGPRKALHLVQVGSQQLLIGSTPEHISMLSVVRTGFDDVMEARLESAGGDA